MNELIILTGPTAVGKTELSIALAKRIHGEIISQVGNYYVIMAKGDLELIMKELNDLEPAFIEVMPSTLEEVFINEMEGVGYGK